MASTYSKPERVRKPRVQIKHKVETEGTRAEQELPRAAGVMSDFSAEPADLLKSLHDRKFIQIDRNNFDDVLARMTPGLELRDEKTLAEHGTEILISSKFAKIVDLEPAGIVAQVPALKSLIETRKQLHDLVSQADRSEGLESLLERIVQNDGDLKQLVEELKLHPTEPYPTRSSDEAQSLGAPKSVPRPCVEHVVERLDEAISATKQTEPDPTQAPSRPHRGGHAGHGRLLSQSRQ
jgi:type VI secretion system protein ImpB